MVRNCRSLCRGTLDAVAVLLLIQSDRVRQGERFVTGVILPFTKVELQLKHADVSELFARCQVCDTTQVV